MNKKKIFGIGAGIILLLTAMIPVVGSVKISSEPILSNYNIIDSTCRYNREEYHLYDSLLYRIFFYDVEYTIEVPEENVGQTITFLLQTPTGIMRDWDVKPTSTYYKETHELALIENEWFSESKFARQNYTLDICNQDATDLGLVEYWSDDLDYIPNDTHLGLTLYNETWVDHQKEFDFDGELLKIPVFKDIYTKYAFPTIFSSDRMGWIGNFVDLTLDWGIALCEFLKEFLEVARDIAALFFELQLLLADIESMIATVGAAGIVTQVQVDAFFALLIAMVGTFGLLLKDIKELPINENSPNYYLKENLMETGDALHSFLSTYPWQDDISITGEVNNCLGEEVITLYCRDDVETIPGEAGKRPIDVKIDAGWKLGQGLIFRNCQVKIIGDKHEGKELKTIKFLSYVAPGGTLKCYFGFPKKSRSLEVFALIILQKFFDIYPNMFPILQRLLNL